MLLNNEIFFVHNIPEAYKTISLSLCSCIKLKAVKMDFLRIKTRFMLGVSKLERVVEIRAF